MKSRNKIIEKISYQIKSGVEFKQEGNFCTWKDLLSLKDKLKPGDIILDLHYQQHSTPYSQYDEDVNLEYVPMIQIGRERLETDKEYYKRMEVEEASKRIIEEKEKLEYLRLRAKFKGNGSI